MDVSPIGNGNFYITVSSDEIEGCDIEALVRKNVSLFSRNTFLEVFSSEEGALVFARVRRGTPVVFAFSGIESVIEASKHCDIDSVAYLAYSGGEYKMIYYPWDDETPPGALYEFCSSSAVAHPDYQRHIEEHGQLLLGPFAVEQINELFA